MIKYNVLVKKTMPPEKLVKAKQCIIGHYLLRPICNILSIPLIEMDIDPTFVTKVSGIFPIIAFLLYAFMKSNIGFWLGWMAMLTWNILDGIDGNIARYNDKCSIMGDFWDALTGWEALIVFYFGMGFISLYSDGKIVLFQGIEPWWFIFMGAISAMNVIFPRLVMYKKEKAFGNKAITMLNRANYSGVKLLVFNITSINGGASVILALAYALGFMRECMFFYFCVTTCICLYSLYSLTKDEGNERK